MSTPDTFQNEFRFVFFSPVELYEATIAFYRDVMRFPLRGGFGEDPGQVRGTYIQAASGLIEIIADPEESALFSSVLESGQRFQAARGGYFLIEVHNVDEIYRRLVDQGAAIHRAVTDWPWGFRDFMIQDPCGNTLCLFSRI